MRSSIAYRSGSIYATQAAVYSTEDIKKYSEYCHWLLIVFAGVHLIEDLGKKLHKLSLCLYRRRNSSIR